MRSKVDRAVEAIAGLGFTVRRGAADGEIALNGFGALAFAIAIEQAVGVVGLMRLPLPKITTWDEAEQFSLFLEEQKMVKHSSRRDESAVDAKDLRLGRWIDLAPFSDSAGPLAYFLASEDPSLFRDQYGSFLPSPDFFHRTKFDTSLCSLIINRARTVQPIGLVRAHTANDSSGWVRITWSILSSEQTPEIEAEVFTSFTRYLFSAWSFRKLYYHIPEYKMRSMEEALRLGLVTQEGALQKHLYFAGAWHDERILAVYRGVSLDNLVARYLPPE